MSEVNNKKHLEQLLHDNRVRKINKLYAAYKLSPNGDGLNDLLTEVIRLAKRKLRGQSMAQGDVGLEDFEDFAQKVAINLWETIDTIEPDNFYAWVANIITARRTDLYRHLKSEAAGMVAMTLSDEEGNEYDNPAVYTETGVVYGATAYIPEGLDEDDELICYMIADKKSYEEIARFLDVGVRTVERRVAGLKERYGKEVQFA